MTKDPAVLFYTSDFLSGVSFFTDEQVGQYIKLLCQQHQLGVIPKNHMINICKSYDSPVISKFAQDEHGDYYNVRMRLEAEKRSSYCESRSNNRSGRPKDKIIRKSYVNHMGNENENKNDNIKDNNKAEFDFEKIWDKYPNKDGKKAAIRYFRSSVKTKEDFKNINLALDNYLKSERVKNGYIKNGSTFFNNWRDFISWDEPLSEAKKDKKIFDKIVELSGGKNGSIPA